MTDIVPAYPGKKLTPRDAVANLQAISAEGYSHVGRYAGAAVLAVFEMTGGAERMARWADDHYGDYATKVFPKLIQRSQSVEHSGTVTLDDAITRLESQTIEADYEEVEPTYDL